MPESFINERINVLKADHSVDVGTIIKKRFILEQKIGEGGMGTIYKARDLRREEANASNPYVALKVVNETFKKHPKTFAALQHEANKSQALNHDNIIRVFDFDRDEDTAFLTMEYLQGITLDKLMHTFAMHGLNYTQKLNLISTIAKALAYAHKQDCIHGDLKPSNIFITNDNVVKIIDFGLANANNEIANNSAFRPEELLAFTPAYASAEIVAHQKPTEADDVYAFACLAYEFLTGAHPYQKKSAKEVNQLQQKVKKIQYMPKQQWHVLHKALATNARKRNVSMQAMVNAFSKPNLTAKKWWWLAAGVLIVCAMLLVNQLDPII